MQPGGGVEEQAQHCQQGLPSKLWVVRFCIYWFVGLLVAQQRNMDSGKLGVVWFVCLFVLVVFVGLLLACTILLSCFPGFTSHNWSLGTQEQISVDVYVQWSASLTTRVVFRQMQLAPKERMAAMTTDSFRFHLYLKFWTFLWSKIYANAPQISDKYWCEQPGSTSANVCNVSCSGELLSTVVTLHIRLSKKIEHALNF